MSKFEPLHEVRVWLRKSDYRNLKAKADAEGISQSEAIRQAVVKSLGESAATASAPWLADMLDAVLAKYFQGFPQVLDRLIVAGYEQGNWSNAQSAKLLEMSGSKDITDRISELMTQIKADARQKADAFFQSLSGPEELIEPPDDDEEPDD